MRVKAAATAAVEALALAKAVALVWEFTKVTPRNSKPQCNSSRLNRVSNNNNTRVHTSSISITASNLRPSNINSNRRNSRSSRLTIAKSHPMGTFVLFLHCPRLFPRARHHHLQARHHLPFQCSLSMDTALP
jgi:hypothetical protein